MQIAHGHSSPGGDNILYDVWLHYSGQIKEEEVITGMTPEFKGHLIKLNLLILSIIDHY